MRRFICPESPATPANMLNHTGTKGGAEKGVREEKKIIHRTKFRRRCLSRDSDINLRPLKRCGEGRESLVV